MTVSVPNHTRYPSEQFAGNRGGSSADLSSSRRRLIRRGRTHLFKKIKWCKENGKEDLLLFIRGKPGDVNLDTSLFNQAFLRVQRALREKLLRPNRNTDGFINAQSVTVFETITSAVVDPVAVVAPPITNTVTIPAAPTTSNVTRGAVPKRAQRSVSAPSIKRVSPSSASFRPSAAGSTSAQSQIPVATATTPGIRSSNQKRADATASKRKLFEELFGKNPERCESVATHRAPIKISAGPKSAASTSVGPKRIAKLPAQGTKRSFKTSVQDRLNIK